MKKYIKPIAITIEVQGETLLAGSVVGTNLNNEGFNNNNAALSNERQFGAWDNMEEGF